VAFSCHNPVLIVVEVIGGVAWGLRGHGSVRRRQGPVVKRIIGFN
jgi:hypothetical protein